ncbi:hypothetical protein SKAU_G00147710 [Synaphobranchus kaupii]|uniref:Uncharacterized protein n=1 Tax=Synaphobranchus kaupii TaxID=118154 RepID=A0A9Q1FUG1_SYNKA|nr:hypothetical protein SKAU_G00147710 [Synaphobranchus kaupii]
MNFSSLAAWIQRNFRTGPELHSGDGEIAICHELSSPPIDPKANSIREKLPVSTADRPWSTIVKVLIIISLGCGVQSGSPQQGEGFSWLPKLNCRSAGPGVTSPSCHKQLAEARRRLGPQLASTGLSRARAVMIYTPF